MASKDSVLTRQILSKGVVGQVSDNLGVAIRLKYQGTGAVTSVAVTSATSIVTTTTGTNEGAKTYAFATYTTVGSLVDAINSDGIFAARVLDTLRSYASANAFVTNAGITISNTGYYDVLNATTSLFFAYRLAVDREVGINGKLRSQHRVHLQEIVTNVTLGGGADTNSLQIYECSPADRGSIETLIYEKTATSGSANTTNWASGNGKITAAEGNSLVVVVLDATSITGTLTVSGIIE